MDQVRLRAVACIDAACQAAPEGPQASEAPLIVVAHGGVIGQLLRHVWLQQSRRLHFASSEWRSNDNYVRPLRHISSESARGGRAEGGEGDVAKEAEGGAEQELRRRISGYCERPPVNGSITRFSVPVVGGQQGGGWEVLDWADSSHLSGEAAPVAANYDDEQ